MRELQTTDWQTIETVIAAEPETVAAWVFGSAGTGFLKPDSDLDIAVLFNTTPKLDTLLWLRARLQQAMNIEAIDLVVLNNASPVLRFEAISGRAVYCRDMDKRAVFASLTAREYEDEMAFVRQSLR